MIRRSFLFRSWCALLPGVLLAVSWSCLAWDYEAHRVVNQLALASLPTNFPGFVFAPDAAERIAFLAGEPDRWRNVRDFTLSQDTGPDHYLDVEQLADYGLKPEELTPFRLDFVGRLAVIRAASPARFPAPDPTRNWDHTRELPGLLPWALEEYYGRLKSAFSCLKAFQQHGGTAAEIRNAEENVLLIMGTMGHFAGDAAQPLHTTVHHHGWAAGAPNPRGFTSNSTFHAWIDGGFFAKTGGLTSAPLRSAIHPAHALTDTGRGVEVFETIVRFVVAQNQQVVPLYELEKDGALTPESPKAAQGRAFLEHQIELGAGLLGDLWLTAWQHAPEDNFLRARLAERAAAKSAP